MVSGYMPFHDASRPISSRLYDDTALAEQRGHGKILYFIVYPMALVPCGARVKALG